MSGFTGSPRLLKGAIISGYQAIVFQYNPEKLTRSLTANTAPSPGYSTTTVSFGARTVIAAHDAFALYARAFAARGLGAAA